MYKYRRYNKLPPTSAALKRAFIRGDAINARRTTMYNKRRNFGTVAATRGFAANYGSGIHEKKVNDLSVATYQANTTGSITLLALPILGSDFNQRIGRKIFLRSLYVRGSVKIENSGVASAIVTPSQQARMIILLDKQPNGAAPAITDILVSAHPASQLNLNNRDRFNIIKDKCYTFGPYTVSTTATQSFAAVGGGIIYNVKMYKKLKCDMIFNATNGGTIADINSGALYMVWIGDQASSSSDINAILSTRVRFDDN